MKVEEEPDINVRSSIVSATTTVVYAVLDVNLDFCYIITRDEPGSRSGGRILTKVCFLLCGACRPKESGIRLI